MGQDDVPYACMGVPYMYETKSAYWTEQIKTNKL